MEILGGVFGRMIATQNFGQRPELGGEVEADFMQQTVTAGLLQHGRKISRLFGKKTSPSSLLKVLFSSS